MSTLLETFSPWKRGQFVPANQRQLKLLETWEAFIDEHPADFNEIVNQIPDALEVCWQLSLKQGKG